MKLQSKMPSSKIKGKTKSIWLEGEIMSKLKKTPPPPNSPRISIIYGNMLRAQQETLLQFQQKVCGALPTNFSSINNSIRDI